MTQEEIDYLSLDLGILDAIYFKWAQEDDMSGVLNVKLTKAKNADFRLKMDQWKARKNERKQGKKRMFENGKALRAEFEKSKTLFNMDRELILKCLDEFYDFDEKAEMLRKDNKTINNFLGELPETSHQMLELIDLERLSKSEQTKFNTKFNMLNEFVNCVKQDCVVSSKNFLFQDLPDLIVRKMYSRKDYDDIIKIIIKVKNRFIAERANANPEKPMAQHAIITDDDECPLEFFDWVLS